MGGDSINFEMSIFQSTNAQNLERTLLENALSISNAAGGALYLVDALSQNASLNIALAILDPVGLDAGQKGREERFFPHIPLRDEQSGQPLLSSPVPYVANTLKSINVADVNASTEFHFQSIIATGEALGHPVRSFLAVPITSPDGDLWGVLTLINATDFETGLTAGFSVETEEQVKVIAMRAGAALSCRAMKEQLEVFENSLIGIGGKLVDLETPGDGGFASAATLLLEDLAEAARGSAMPEFSALTSLSPDEWRDFHKASHLRYFGWITPDIDLHIGDTTEFAEELWGAIEQNRERSNTWVQGLSFPETTPVAADYVLSAQRTTGLQVRNIADVCDAFVSLTFIGRPEKKVLTPSNAHTILRRMRDSRLLNAAYVELLRQGPVCDRYFEIALNGRGWDA